MFYYSYLQKAGELLGAQVGGADGAALKALVDDLAAQC